MTDGRKGQTRDAVGDSTFKDATWPTAPGTYLLFFSLQAAAPLTVGKLGEFHLSAGCYVYIGSAHGPGGLRARLNRHTRRDKRLHWHIDYLAALEPIREVHAVAADTKTECAWVRKLLAVSGASVPIPRFGNSDCHERCPAHLIQLPTAMQPAQIIRLLNL